MLGKYAAEKIVAKLCSHLIPQLSEIHSGNYLSCLCKLTIGDCKGQLNEKETKGDCSFQFYQFPFFFYFHFMCYFQYFRMKKTRRQKLMTLLINQVLFSFQMRKYSSFAEMNMIIMTITKAQLLLFDNRNMRYPSSKFHYSYLLKSLLLLWLLFFFINRFFLPCVFFL